MARQDVQVPAGEGHDESQNVACIHARAPCCCVRKLSARPGHCKRLLVSATPGLVLRLSGVPATHGLSLLLASARRPELHLLSRIVSATHGMFVASGFSARAGAALPLGELLAVSAGGHGGMPAACWQGQLPPGAGSQLR